MPPSDSSADFGYWQLRHLALRLEAVTAVTPGDDGSYAMPPRLFEEHDWDDEDSETWEDEDMWSGTVGADDSARAPSAPESPEGTPPADVPEPQRYRGSFEPFFSLFTTFIVAGANGESLQHIYFIRADIHGHVFHAPAAGT